MSVEDVNSITPQHFGARPGVPRPDPLNALQRLATRLYTAWVHRTYPFATFGCGVSIHYSCDFSRAKAAYVSFADHVYLATDVWLNVVPDAAPPTSPKIVFGKGCKIGRRSTI